MSYNRLMRAAVIGPQNTGKSTFIKDFTAAHPEYTSPTRTYRDVVEERGLLINQLTGRESQELIRDFLFEQVQTNTLINVIFDRTVLDNYVYTKVAEGNGGIDAAFVKETWNMSAAALKHLDILFFIPTTASISLVDDHLRDTDVAFIDAVNREFVDALLRTRLLSPIEICVLAGSREARVIEAKHCLG